MEEIQGKSIAVGIAIGTLSVWQKQEQTVKRLHVPDVEAEVARYQAASVRAVAALHEIYKKAVAEVGELNAKIFEVHAMLLEDADYQESVCSIIRTQNVNAEYAVAKTGDNFARMFQEMEDAYFRARSADIKDISERVIRELSGGDAQQEERRENRIVMAKDLAPSETIQMDKTNLRAFVTESGSANSHTAILARAMDIPALTGIPVRNEWDGKPAAVDGAKGILYIEPDEDTTKRLMAMQEDAKRKEKLLDSLRGHESMTPDGRKIHLYANIGSSQDVAAALTGDAEGIGLFRTEFLYLEKNDYPTEQEQFLTYQYVAEAMAGKKVIIRTLDIGADKQADYFGLDKEENPALGYRAIRICLDRVDMFKKQLRAILRAAVFGNLSVMFPMITSVDEVKRAKEIMWEAEWELKQEGIRCRMPETGIMIETPAAAMMSRELAKEVDFFSIGTNDLTQYVLACDRQNPRLEHIYSDHHPAVLKMIDMIVKNGHDAGIWVGICGELGADTDMTRTLIDMEIDEISVAPSKILEVRHNIVQTGGCTNAKGSFERAHRDQN